ncbi:cellulase N-terminal Ig-like domain-containing protein [Aporhodopirellula aestuarii]|uniref:Cellulase Ig-like domain-containing protein n=1 Tax=Aporhodopirellula aestuarii TaxID=2950107 RepID=A0ABT0UER5_9BACT|nr:cellulase N-terminal Ig-like domain-containing protein [Aporhodopirellula aestuarii]MCM2374905.1 hypothetical protein [Aporhodopirellula aestuarii]
MSSQVGYDIGDPMRVMIRGDQPDSIPQEARFTVVDAKANPIVEGPVNYWGEKWGAHWWISDFSGLQDEGNYRILVQHGTKLLCKSESIEVGGSILWDS